MALLYHSIKWHKEHKEVIIRAINDDTYAIAITFPDEEDDDEDAVTEILLTKEEVVEAYDVLFNQ